MIPTAKEPARVRERHTAKPKNAFLDVVKEKANNIQYSKSLLYIQGAPKRNILIKFAEVLPVQS